MKPAIVARPHPVTLVGAGESRARDIADCLKIAPTLVAADGGGDKCLAAGLIPEAVIGDLDSVSAATRAALPADALHRIVEQDSTDFGKSLRHIAAPLVLGAGFAGPRIDHLLACLNALVRHADRRCILLAREDILFLAPPRLRFQAPPGTRVSLFPMARMRGRSDGLDWPIDGLTLAPDGRVGTSNRASGGTVTLETDAAKLVVILPLARLGETARALLAEPSTWPAP